MIWPCLSMPKLSKLFDADSKPGCWGKIPRCFLLGSRSQELDDEYLIVWQGFSGKPWDYKTEAPAAGCCGTAHGPGLWAEGAGLGQDGVTPRWLVCSHDFWGIVSQ